MTRTFEEMVTNIAASLRLNIDGWKMKLSGAQPISEAMSVSGRVRHTSCFFLWKMTIFVG